MISVEGLIEVSPVEVRDGSGRHLELDPCDSQIGDIESFEWLKHVEVYVDNTFRYPGMSTQSTHNQIERNKPPEANAFSIDVRLSEAGEKGYRGLTYYKVELKQRAQPAA